MFLVLVILTFIDQFTIYGAFNFLSKLPMPPLVHPFIKAYKSCHSKNDDGIENPLSGIMAIDPKFASM